MRLIIYSVNHVASWFFFIRLKEKSQISGSSIICVEHQTIPCFRNVSMFQLAILTYTLIADYNICACCQTTKSLVMVLVIFFKLTFIFTGLVFLRKAMFFTLFLVHLLSVLCSSNYSPFMVQIIFLLLCVKLEPAFTV